MFLHNVVGRKIYPTLLRPRRFVHYSFSIISSRPEGLPKSPRPRLFKPDWASNIRRQFFVLEKKHFYTWCPGLIVHALITISVPLVCSTTAETYYECGKLLHFVNHICFQCKSRSYVYPSRTPYLFNITVNNDIIVPRARAEEDLNMRELLRRAHLAGPVSLTCFDV